MYVCVGGGEGEIFLCMERLCLMYELGEWGRGVGGEIIVCVCISQCELEGVETDVCCVCVYRLFSVSIWE